jgi:hypothetical protein
MARHIGACRACGAAMLWAETPDGNRQPFNPKPDPEGNRVLLGRGRDRSPLAVPVTALGDYEGAAPLSECFYMPHHATCPERDRFRRAKKGAQ